MTQFGLGIFSFGIKRPSDVILKKGESAIVAEWSWKKFGYVRKFATLDENGDLRIQKF